MVQCSRLMASSPEVRGAAHAGVLGVAQTRLLAKVFANPRCATQFAASAALLVDHGSSLWFDEFEVVVRRWEALADADGAHRAHERAHAGRDAHVSVVDEHVYLDARGGIAAGSVIEEISNGSAISSSAPTGIRVSPNGVTVCTPDCWTAAVLNAASMPCWQCSLPLPGPGRSASVIRWSTSSPTTPPSTTTSPASPVATPNRWPQDRGPASLRNQSRLPDRPRRSPRRGAHRAGAQGDVRLGRGGHRPGAAFTPVHRRGP